MQVGFEDRSSSERDRDSAEAGSASSFGALTARAVPTSLPNILIPQVWVGTDEVAHQANAFRIVENRDACSVLPEKFLRALEVSILSNDDARNTKQQCRAGAHDAGTESADQRQLSPITPPACVAQADRFGMRRGIAALNSQVVSSGNNLPLPVRQNRTDRQTAFAQTLPRLFESFLQ
jgi:hypothetical protein